MQYRSLGPGFWPSSIAFGKRTVIYGHNGSGKSTFSDLLLEIAMGLVEERPVKEAFVRHQTRVPNPKFA